MRKEKILESALTGEPVIALCGKVWVPGRDPKKFPVCPVCKEIYEGCAPRRTARTDRSGQALAGAATRDNTPVGRARPGGAPGMSRAGSRYPRTPMSTTAASHLSPAFPERAAWGTAGKLRAWQAEALEQYLREHPRDFLAVATPGAGKTTFALRLATELLRPRASSSGSPSSRRPST